MCIRDRYVVCGTVLAQKVIDKSTDELKSWYYLADTVLRNGDTFYICMRVIDVEFDENITIDDAKQKVKDLVDGITSGPDWPVFNNAKVEPNIFELDFSEFQPILNISLIGDYPIEQLKSYAEKIQNRIEQLSQIKEVNIRGIQIFEVEVAVDIYKMTAAKVSFNDILGAISQENSTISNINKFVILNKNFFLQPEEVVFRSLTEVLKSVGKKYYPVRGKKIEKLIFQIKNDNSLMTTLGNCVIKKVNNSVIVSKER